MDVEHDELGRGWVWGSGRGVVTVRFETAETEPGPVRSYPVDDPALHVWLPAPVEDQPVEAAPGEVAGDGRTTSPWSRSKG
jgi:DNA polymerase-4